MNDYSKILASIATYSAAYSQLEELQRDKSLLPPGDQKTDCIGEFYAHLYLLEARPRAAVTPGGHSNKAWDFRVSDAGHDTLVQVKTVSGYSATRVLSPIHHGWDELFVVSLDHKFRPDGFWVVPAPDLEGGAYPLRGIRAPAPGGPGTVVRMLDFSRDHYSEFMRAIPPGPSPSAGETK
jgi:hypothetical protein